MTEEQIKHAFNFLATAVLALVGAMQATLPEEVKWRLELARNLAGDTQDETLEATHG